MKYLFYTTLLVLILYGGYQAEQTFGIIEKIAGKTIVNISRSTFDLGTLIQGEKISIRDKITQNQTYTYFIDGHFGSLGDENKKGAVDYKIEIGYKPTDIISSEKIDSSNFWGTTTGRSLIVNLPKPDTLQFISTTRKEEDNTSGVWHYLQGYEMMKKKEYNNAKRQAIYDSLTIVAYQKYQEKYVENIEQNLKEAARSMYNYINNAYDIGKEQGFDEVVSIFDFESMGKTYHLEIKCTENYSRVVNKQEIPLD